MHQLIKKTLKQLILHHFKSVGQKLQLHKIEPDKDHFTQQARCSLNRPDRFNESNC